MDLDAANVARLLDRRTAALATRPAWTREAPVEATRSLLIWEAGESLFGTDIAAVAAVLPFTGCARVPTREAACLGVIGHTGRFYSVIGICRLLGLAAGDAPPGHLLLLRGAAPYLALAADRVLGRFDLAAVGHTLAFEGRLVAPFGPAEAWDRLVRRPLESIPS